MIRAILAFLLSLAGCTETIRFEVDALDNLVSLDIVPDNAMVQITDLAPPFHTLQYAAIGHFSDGTQRDISDLVTWAIDRDVLGAFAERGVFVASHAAAGHGTVAARIRGLQATGSIQVSIDATIIDATFPPPGAGLFSPTKPVVTGDPDRSPAVVYPSDGVFLPAVIASTLFQLATGTGNDAYRISFDNEVLHLRVETGADRWRADGAIQRLIASSSGTAPLRVSIEATAAGASSIYAGPSLDIAFSGDLIDAPLYFWSASTNGIMRGGVDLVSASKVYPSSGTCVGCHTISRTGHALAAAVDDGSATTFQLEALDLDTQQPLIPASATRPMGWAAYSPDGSRLVVANDGVLTLYNANTGLSLGVVPLPAMRYATHPDWSPDGSSLAVALTAMQPTSMEVRAASIAVIPFNGTWGTPTMLVTGANNNNNYFPRWSPDGTMLAYVHATGPSRGAPSAELMLVSAAGGTPQLLARANQRVGAEDRSDLANTMPSWAPRVGPRLWLAFASARPYGNVVSGGPTQIWITSLDFTSPGDPSTPAFWLPCQDVTVLNNNPVWWWNQATTL